ncbi:hypothetical protein PoB_002730000 [Plakobranchus ocellatus]|uniref:Uncharacterized protein n=1 Tax=Plakobranchus ocellatus TaxID=259542 RepID=A0AAV4A1K4_9GAST|nr:hypothetical protein PoB_002730000 [Plakobranchus ocellatus]
MATSNDLLIKQRFAIEFLAAEGCSAANIHARMKPVMIIHLNTKSIGYDHTRDYLQGPFCRGFEPRHRRPGLTEGLKA